MLEPDHFSLIFVTFICCTSIHPPVLTLGITTNSYNYNLQIFWFVSIRFAHLNAKICFHFHLFWKKIQLPVCMGIAGEQILNQSEV